MFVAHGGCAGRRSDDVDKQDRSKDTRGHCRRQGPGEEVLDLVQKGILVAHPRQVVRPGELHEPRAGDLLGDPAAFLHECVSVVGAMQDQRGNLDRRQDAPNVDLGVHPHECRRGAGAGTLPEVRGEPARESLVVGSRRRQLRDARVDAQSRSVASISAARASAVGAHG